MSQAYLVLTEQDLTHGLRCDTGACPLARSAKRALGWMLQPGEQIDVDTQAGGAIIEAWNPETRRFRPLAEGGPEMAEFIRDFDGGQHVELATFAVVLPYNDITEKEPA